MRPAGLRYLPLGRRFPALLALALTPFLFRAERSFANTPFVPFVVPIQIHYGHIEVDGTLNGKSAHFILDSGATPTVITPDAARRFGLSLEKEAATARGVGGNATIRKAGSVTIGIGQALLQKQEAYAIAFPEQMNAQDGLLGFPFLQRFVVTIDYEHHRMGVGSDAATTIAAVENSVAAEQRKPGNAVRLARAISLPLSLDGGVPSIEASVEGHPARLDIDTGAGGTLTLFAPWVDKLHLRDHFRQRLQTTTGKGIGGTVSSDVVRISALTLGTGTAPTDAVTLHGVVTDLSRQTSGAFAVKKVSGQIGAGVLDRFLVTFDSPHSRLLLTPNSHLSDPFVYNREGCGIDEQGGKYVAVAVLPGGPAALAGLRNGDVIVSIDGVPIRKIKEAEDKQYFHRPVGAVLRVVYQRGGQKSVEARVTLREMLP